MRLSPTHLAAKAVTTETRSTRFSSASRRRCGIRRQRVVQLKRISTVLRSPSRRLESWVTTQDEVDTFLELVKIELTRRAPGRDPKQPIRCLLYRYGGWDPATPVLAIDVGTDAIGVIDLSSNALVASVSLAEVTAKPAQYGGSPVLVVEGPGLQTLTITPHPPPGQWRKWPKSKKPAYLALEAEWLTLAEKFGLASDLVGEWAPQTFLEHAGRFIEEFGPHAPTTWRTPLVFGLLFGVPGALALSPIALVSGVILLIVAAVAWRFRWEI